MKIGLNKRREKNKKMIGKERLKWMKNEEKKEKEEKLMELMIICLHIGTFLRIEQKIW